MLLNCGVGEDSWESLRLQGDQISHPQGHHSWIFTGRLMLNLKFQSFGHPMRWTDSLEKTLMLGKIEGRRRRAGWDGWMASVTQWTWVRVNFGRWWWTGKLSMLLSMGSQRFRHKWATELNRIDKFTLTTTLKVYPVPFYSVFSVITHWRTVIQFCCITSQKHTFLIFMVFFVSPAAGQIIAGQFIFLSNSFSLKQELLFHPNILIR